MLYSVQFKQPVT